MKISVMNTSFKPGSLNKFCALAHIFLGRYLRFCSLLSGIVDETGIGIILLQISGDSDYLDKNNRILASN